MNNRMFLALLFACAVMAAASVWREQQSAKWCAGKCKSGTVVVECDPPRVVCEKWEIEVKP